MLKYELCVFIFIKYVYNFKYVYNLYKILIQLFYNNLFYY